MELETSTLMFIFFILFLVMSIWKIWAFLPNKQLVDDDRTPEAYKELQNLMLKVIQKNRGEVNIKELFSQMKDDEAFNTKLFWRFNQNRLTQLLKEYYRENPQTSSIKEIYERL